MTTYDVTVGFHVWARATDEIEAASPEGEATQTHLPKARTSRSNDFTCQSRSSGHPNHTLRELGQRRSTALYTASKIARPLVAHRKCPLPSVG